MVDCFYVGSSRTGSTWLYRQLNTHPQIHMPINKPVRFWNRKIFGIADDKSNHPKLNLDQYVSLMKPVSGKKVLDMTDGYSVLDTVSIDHIHKRYPKAKILFTLRNPVDIYISHQLLHSTNVDEALSVKRTLDRIKDPYSYSSLNGEQSKNIERWAYYYGKENIGCFFYDFMKQDQYAYIKSIANFIGIEDTHWDNATNLEKKVNIRRTDKEPSEEVYDLLYEHYIPEIENLERVLSVDLKEWKERKPAKNLNKKYKPV